MTPSQIESEARRVQFEIWQYRETLFPMGVPPPRVMFEPSTAARALGLEYIQDRELGRFGHADDKFEVAGMLDRDRGIIAVSPRFDYPTRRFTGAHELGHFVMHTGQVMYRDRPIFDMQGRGRPKLEKEADYFAACFLAPKKLVIQAYQARFISGPPLHLTEDVAWNLLGESAHELLGPCAGSLHFAAAVAGATRFNGQHFTSLADLFGLSVSAMAIRLQELELVAD